MNKKILSVVLIAVLALTAIISGTLAYFTDNEKAVNTFTLGNVDIDLTESNWTAPTTAVPGVRYAKNPEVKNIGKNDAWIRVDVTLSDAKEFKAAATKYGITNLATIFEVGTDFDTKWILAGVDIDGKDSANDTLTYSYYYKNKLLKDESTGTLFTAVTIPKEFNNADMQGIRDDFDITITAHAIQDADGFNNVQDAFAGYIFEAKTPTP